MAVESTKRVLKFGLVQDGKIIEEGILGEKEGVTIGSDPSNTITISEGRVPKKHKLIEPHGDSYRISVFEGLDGKISSGKELYSLDRLQTAKAATKKGQYYEMPLDPNSKGKLTLGNTTILFQLVPPPPPPPILKLPKELRANIWSGVDLFFVTVILLSALFHISVVLYLDNIERDPELTSAELQRFTTQLITTEEVELIEEEMTEDEKLEEKGPKKPSGSGGGQGGSIKQGEDEGVENKGLLALITKEGKGGSVADIISQGMGDDLASAIAGIGGVDVATNSSAVKGTRGRPGGNGANSVGVKDLSSYGNNQTVKGPARVEKVVKAKIGGGPGGVSGKIDSASVYSVIRSRIGGVRYCYESQLKTNPSLAGKIRVQFVIGGSGGVASCAVVSNSMGNAYVQNCVCRMVGRWKFPAPEEGTVTVGYTFIFSAAN